MNNLIPKYGFAIIATVLVFANQGCGVPFEATPGRESLSSSGTPGAPNAPPTGKPPIGEPTVGKTCTQKSPLEATLPQRLTKIEYNNAIRDIFDTAFKNYTTSFANDPAGETGFSTEASAQAVSPTTVQDYWNAAQVVINDVFSRNPNPLISCTSQDEGCARTIIQKLSRRAYRRTASNEEINQLISVFRETANTDFPGKLKAVVLTILMNPQFIFRAYELPSGVNDVVSLTDIELASKLSFFLWGSIPDDELLNAAEAGDLKKLLKEQVIRMLKNPKATYLARAFGDQWLGLANLQTLELDLKIFPEWNDEIKASMKEETLQFLKDILLNDGSVMSIVNAEHTFVDQNMANIYKIPGSFSPFTKVTLSPNERRGLLTHASILSMTSAGDHTLPVVRGKWVLEKILCSPPPPPPDDFPLEEPEQGNLVGESTIRKRLEAHRNQGGACFGCHAAMDPIGLSFENYNSMGVYRTNYVDGVTIDASGKLPSGEPISNVVDLSNLLEGDKRFPTCFTAKLSSFAQARNMTTPEHKCYAQTLSESSVGKDKKFSDLILSMISSYEFLNRKVGQ